jgi:glucose uptake protein
MILPQTYLQALLLAIVSALCLGCWANFYKLTGKWRFELFYWDFALGALVAALIAAFTFGSLGFEFGGGDGFVFLDDLMRAGKRSIAYGLAAGVIFNLGNMLLVAAISVAGMSIAFPITFGLGLVIGVTWNYILKPQGNPTLLLAGAVLALAAVVADVLACRALSIAKATAVIKAGKTKSTKPKASWKGIILSLTGGVLMGCFLPLLDMCRTGDLGLGPYAAAVAFAAGMLVSTCGFNLFFMNLPVQGEPVELLAYFRSRMRHHLLGLAGGATWAAGTVISFIVSSATKGGGVAVLNSAAPPLFSPAAGFAFLQSAVVISALWGLFAWKELQGADSRIRILAVVALALFATGVALVSLAPSFAA